MDSRVEKMERSLLELKKENQIRLEEIKQLWKRRKGDYLRRRSRRDHAPARHRRTLTCYVEEEKNEEILVDLKLQHSDLGNSTLLPGAMDSNLTKSEAKEEENDEREHRDADSVAEVIDEGKEPLPDEVFKPLNAVSFSGSWIRFNFILLSPDPVRSSYCEFETFATSISTPLPGKTTVSTIAAALETDLHHCVAALFLSDQPSATVRPNHCHRDAVVQPRSDLKPPLPLGAETRKEIVGDRRVLPPKPPKPPDRGVFVVEVGTSHGVALLLLAMTEEHDKKERDTIARAEWALKGMDLTSILMGQAQTSNTNSVQFNKGGRMFQEEKGIVKKVGYPVTFTTGYFPKIRGHRGTNLLLRLLRVCHPMAMQIGITSIELLGNANINSLESGSPFTLKIRDQLLDYILTLMGQDNNYTFAFYMELFRTEALVVSACTTLGYVKPRLTVAVRNHLMKTTLRLLTIQNDPVDVVKPIVDNLIIFLCAIILISGEDGRSMAELLMLILRQIDQFVLFPVEYQRERGYHALHEVLLKFQRVCVNNYCALGCHGSCANTNSEVQILLALSYIILPCLEDVIAIQILKMFLQDLAQRGILSSLVSGYWATLSPVLQAGLHIQIQQGGTQIQQEEYLCNRDEIGSLVFQQWDPGGSKISRWKPQTFLFAAMEIHFSVRGFRQWDPGGLCRLFICHLEDKVSFEGGGIDANPLHPAQMSSGAQRVV